MSGWAVGSFPQAGPSLPILITSNDASGQWRMHSSWRSPTPSPISDSTFKRLFILLEIWDLLLVRWHLLRTCRPVSQPVNQTLSQPLTSWHFHTPAHVQSTVFNFNHCNSVWFTFGQSTCVQFLDGQWRVDYVAGYCNSFPGSKHGPCIALSVSWVHLSVFISDSWPILSLCPPLATFKPILHIFCL